MQGSEILQIFNSHDNFIDLCRNSVHFTNTMQRFCWRLQYIIGQTILYLQNHLIQTNILDNCYLLNLNDIHELATAIIEEAKQPNQNLEFLNLKKSIDIIFNNGQINEEEIIISYATCMKIWKDPFEFDLNFIEFKDASVEIQHSNDGPKTIKNTILNAVLNNLPENIQENTINPNPNPNPRYGPYSVLRMPQNSAQGWDKNKKPNIFPVQKSKYIKNKMKNGNGVSNSKLPYHYPNSNHRQKTRPKGIQTNGHNKAKRHQASTSNAYKLKGGGQQQIINLRQMRKQQPRPPKCFNRNWSLIQQGYFCKLYIDCQTSQIVKQQLQKKYGTDARWHTPKQIDSKMQALVAKVFKKFNALETINANIIKFRTLKNLIISSDQMDPMSRKAAFKHIASIYEAMLNVTQSKKAIISQKILEIINICKTFQNNV